MSKRNTLFTTRFYYQKFLLMCSSPAFIIAYKYLYVSQLKVCISYKYARCHICERFCRLIQRGGKVKDNKGGGVGSLTM